MPEISADSTHLFSILFFLFLFNFSLFFFFFLRGAHWPSLFRCPNTDEFKVSHGKLNSRGRDWNLCVHNRSKVCVCAQVPKEVIP